MNETVYDNVSQIRQIIISKLPHNKFGQVGLYNINEKTGPGLKLDRRTECDGCRVFALSFLKIGLTLTSNE